MRTAPQTPQVTYPGGVPTLVVKENGPSGDRVVFEATCSRASRNNGFPLEHGGGVAFSTSASTFGVSVSASVSVALILSDSTLFPVSVLLSLDSVELSLELVSGLGLHFLTGVVFFGITLVFKVLVSGESTLMKRLLGFMTRDEWTLLLGKTNFPTRLLESRRCRGGGTLRRDEKLRTDRRDFTLLRVRRVT